MICSRPGHRVRVGATPLRHVPLGAIVLGALLLAAGARAGDAASGARIAAARCVSCHASNEGIHAMLPLLEGQPKAAFLAQWRAFRERRRTAPAMVGLAGQLSEQEVEDLAEHYAALVPPPSAERVGSDAGRALAERLQCAGCHGPAFQGTAAGAPRLAGQKARYTAWALQTMRGGNRPHGSGTAPDPVLAALTNTDIESLAAHFASLR